MKTTTANYKLIKRIKDDKFDVDDLHHYNLSVQIGVRDFQLCVIDTRDSRCLVLEDYVVAKVSSYSELLENLKILFDDHQLLKAGFWKVVKVSFKNNKYSFIPTSLFDKDSLYEYLSVNCKVNPISEEFHYYKHIKSDVVNVFAVNRELSIWVQELYPNAQVVLTHQASTLIEGVLKQDQGFSENTLFLYIDRFKLHLIATKNKGLAYYNQFPIKQFADYMKYITLVMTGLQYDQKASHVVLWGYIGKQSPHYNEFYKFIRNISFGDRPPYLSYGYIFDEVQDHHFFDLYSTYLCD